MTRSPRPASTPAPRCELFRALAVLTEPPDRTTSRVARLLGIGRAPERWEHTELFVEQLVPYASVYLGPEGMIGGQARDRVAGFWRVFGAVPPPEPDHLGTLLGLLAHLQERELEEMSRASPRAVTTGWAGARRTLVQEHLLSWLPLWLVKVQEIGAEPYRRWARLLAAVLDQEPQLEQSPAGGTLPAHLREAPDFPEPGRVSGEDLVAALLTPVRAGFIVTRADLRRAADELGLGLRAGERRYTLRALLGQDAARVLSWIADQARRSSPAVGPPAVSEFWRRRAERTAHLLRDRIGGFAC